MDLVGIGILFFFLRKDYGPFVFVVMGSLAVFGPSELTPAKLIYLSTLVVLSIRSGVRTLRLLSPLVRNYYLSIFLVHTIFILYMLFVCLYAGFSYLSIGRGLVPQVIFLLSLPIFFEAGIQLDAVVLLRICILSGFISAFSVYILWAQRHGLISLGFERFLYDGDWISFVSILIAVSARDMNYKLSLLEKSLVVLTVLLMFGSLSRTNFILIFSIILGRQLMKLKIRYFISLFITSSALVYLSLKLSSLYIHSPNVIARRLAGSIHLISIGGLSSGGLGSDLSLKLRSDQTQLAKAIFAEHPAFGIGLLPSDQTFDTIWATPMQFGIIGTSLMAFLLLFLFNLSWKVSSNFRRTLVLFFLLLLPASFIYNWPSNKSFWVATGFLIAFTLNLRREKMKSNYF